MPKRKKNLKKEALKDRQWVEGEFGSLELSDERLERRVKKMLGDMGAQPGASLPQASGDWGATKGAYRFLDNEEVEAEAMLRAHREAMLERARSQRVVLAVQDTTALNFSAHPQTTGLGPIGKNQEKTIGLVLHSTLVVAEDGQALGILERQLTAREPKRLKAEPVGARNRKPVEQKESVKWLRSLEATVRAAQGLPQTLWLNIADREADSYDLFWRWMELRADATQRAGAERVELLVRCRHNRVLSAGQERLFGHLAGQAVVGHYQFAVPRKPGRKERPTTLTVRMVEVSLPPPADRAKYQGHDRPLRLWAIQALEEEPPAGEEPICWRLLSTLPVGDAATAILQVQRYSRRWEIEVFHRTLKSGCRVEDRQLETAQRLGRCLILDMIVAWRVQALSKAGRGEHAAQPVSQWLETHEWQALWCYIHQQTRAPETPPSTYQAMRWVAQLGGFLGRRQDGHPGAMSLWRGLQRLEGFACAYLLFSTPQKDVGNA